MEKTISNRIRLMRLSRGLSQENVAQELGISVGAYSNIETGKTELTLTRIKNIAKIFKTDYISLIEQTPDNTRLVREPSAGYQTGFRAEDRIQDLEKIVDDQKKEITYLKEIIALMKEKQLSGVRDKF